MIFFQMASISITLTWTKDEGDQERCKYNEKDNIILS